MTTSDTLRLTFIGCGAIARYHLDGIKECAPRTHEALIIQSVLAPEPWWRITGTKGETIIEGGFEGGLLLFDAEHREGLRMAEPLGYAKSFGLELADFEKVVLDGATPAAGPEESLGEPRTVLALYRSVQSDRWEAVWD